MRQRILGALLLVAVALLFVIPAEAHHAVSAEFDLTKTFSVKGTISKLDWINPHVYIYLDVKEPDGNVVNYAFGNASPGFLRRGGVVKTMFHVGDEVTVDAFSPKDGAKHLGFVNAVHFADGHTVILSRNGLSD